MSNAGSIISTLISLYPKTAMLPSPNLQNAVADMGVYMVVANSIAKPRHGPVCLL